MTRLQTVFAALAISIAIAVVFEATRHFEFVNYDDFEFVVENPHVATGLSAANLQWAFQEPRLAAEQFTTALALDAGHREARAALERLRPAP